MKQNGPRSTAELSVVTTIKPAPARMPAPRHLSGAAREVWQEVVSSRPADYFDAASVPLLETYAHATAEHRRLAALVAGLDPVTDLDTLAKLSRLVDVHALRMGAAATKLRLSNQSRYNPGTADTRARAGGTQADRIRANYGRGRGDED